jgi:uncharacterized protein (DUF934 family)
MRRILRQREWAIDPWRYPGERASETDKLIVPLAELHAESEHELRRRAALGVWLAPADDPQQLRADLPRLSLVALEFPNFSDGRGFTQATIVRRLGFAGEVRAVGAGVKRDLLFLMARCGCDAFDLAEGEDPQSALQALGRYTVAYQKAAPLPTVEQVRFGA